MTHSFTEENYLKIIYHLSQRSAGTVQTNTIADEIQTKPASVTDMLKKLSDKKLVNYVKYQGVTLTANLVRFGGGGMARCWPVPNVVLKSELNHV